MDGFKNAFRIVMVFTFLASVVGALGVLGQVDQFQRMGMDVPWGSLMMGACLQVLQVATVWLPAEVLFDLHSKATSGGCRRG